MSLATKLPFYQVSLLKGGMLAISFAMQTRFRILCLARAQSEILTLQRCLYIGGRLLSILVPLLMAHLHMRHDVAVMLMFLLLNLSFSPPAPLLPWSSMPVPLLDRCVHKDKVLRKPCCNLPGAKREELAKRDNAEDRS